MYKYIRLFLSLFFVLNTLAATAQISVELKFFKEFPLPDTDNLKVLMRKAPNEQIDSIIAKNKPKAMKEGASDSMKQNVAAFMVWKALKSYAIEKNSYENIEPLFYDAESILPNDYYVNVAWGDVLYVDKKYSEAVEHYRNALACVTDNADVNLKAGFAAYNSALFEDAAAFFENVLSVNPNSYAACYGAGISYFETKSYEEARDCIEKALEMATVESEKRVLEELLYKVKEFLATSSNSESDEDCRFVVQFAGSSRDDLGDLTFDILDEIYYMVTERLNYVPDVKINIVFFLTDDYYKIGMDWSAASAMGTKIMVPLKSGYRDTDYVKGLLAHEFTHTIINLKTGNRCPLWLHEGLAQYNEFTASYGSPDVIRPDFEGIMQREFVEGDGFIGVQKGQQLITSSSDHKNVARGYVASYMAVRCIADYYGESSFDEILTKLGEGSTIDEAMTEVLGKDQNEFNEECASWLKGL